MEHLAGKILATKKFSLFSELFHSLVSILFYMWKKLKPRDQFLPHTKYFILHIRRLHFTKYGIWIRDAHQSQHWQLFQLVSNGPAGDVQWTQARVSLLCAQRESLGGSFAQPVLSIINVHRDSSSREAAFITNSLCSLSQNDLIACLHPKKKPPFKKRLFFLELSTVKVQKAAEVHEMVFKTDVS